jgi:hypothetical protein
MKDTRTTLSCFDNARGFQIRNLRGFTLSIAIGEGSYCERIEDQAVSMEVAVMDARGKFVTLPYDVAGHVPAGNLGCLIEAVEAHDWERVCSLCDEDADDSENKFPLKD